MCGCDEEDAPERDVIDLEILEKARSRERSLTGEPVPVEAWDIFAGKSGGGVLWAHYQRMQSCYSSTAQLARSLAHMKRERRFTRKIKCSPAAV